MPMQQYHMLHIISSSTHFRRICGLGLMSPGTLPGEAATWPLIGGDPSSCWGYHTLEEGYTSKNKL